MKDINIAIINYPGSLQSAVYGLDEMFRLANHAQMDERGVDRKMKVTFKSAVLLSSDIELNTAQWDAVLIPPSHEDEYYLSPDLAFVEWLRAKHAAGSILCSVCAGAFILARTDIVGDREVTTHWGLNQSFYQQFPEISLNTNKIVINQGDIITSGGMMAWLDLGFELIAQLASPALMRQVGRMLVVDTGAREQQYYQQFRPSFMHGDQEIVEVQQLLHHRFNQSIVMSKIADECRLTVRTMQRRFVKATGITPNQYLQRIRIQQACDALEQTTQSFESIAHQVGYEDPSACRKTFFKIMGLTPSEFRQRFL